MSAAPPEPPGHLATSGARYWAEVVGEWDLEAHQLAILENACTALDRIAQCRNRVRRDGLTITDKTGKAVTHPALAVERQAMRLHAQLVRALQLEDEPEPAPKPVRNKGGRPPADRNYTPRRARAD